MAEATWNGSVWVVLAVGTRPMRVVTGAMYEATSTASRRPRTWSVRPSSRGEVRRLEAEGVLDGDEVEQPPLGRSAEAGPVARREQLAPGRAVGSRHDAGWNPVPSSATARCSEVIRWFVQASRVEDVDSFPRRGCSTSTDTVTLE